jgi:hypothetical protein
MTKLISPLSYLLVLGQDAVHGTLGAQILPLIEKCGVYFCRCLVTKPLTVNHTEHCLALLNRQSPGMRPLGVGGGDGTVEPVVACPGDP